MTYSAEDRIKLAISECLETKETDPIKLFYKIAAKDFIRIHGPEHHFLDGACVLTAFCNAGGEVDLKTGLEKITEESLKMPGAICGLWGVCGSVTSVGSALSVIDGTGPLSTEDWGMHMQYTSKALHELSKTGGPRCCKRDAFIAIRTAVEYINKNYNVSMEASEIKCCFSHRNNECLKERCPFYGKN